MMEELKPSVLVVEDESIVAMDLVSSLEKLHYPVVGVAASGERAIELAQAKRPGLVLMDIHLRGDMDGIEAASRIQEQLFIPIIYLTAYSDDATLERARITYPFGYLLKPFEDREVEVAIQIALYRHKMDHALRDSERRLQAILSSIGDAVIATDTSKRVTFLNRSAEALLGWKTERAEGRLLSDVLKLSSAVGGLRTVSHGSEVTPVEVVESPVLDTGGQPGGYVIVARDISERLRRQEAYERELSERAARAAAEQAHQREQKARAEAEALARVAAALNEAQLDLDAIVQRVTDEATAVVGASFGAFFYNVSDDAGESYMLYSLSGASRQSFDELGMPRNTAIFGETFSGKGVVRLDDVTSDPRYGRTAPHYGMPKGHLPVRSYLAIPVISRTGAVIGGLFFAHPEPGRFTEQHERITKAVAAHAAIAIDNARLFGETREAEERQGRLVRELERAVRFSEMFVGILGHDLRNPLSAILTAAELVLARAESGRVAKPVSRILNSAQRMSRMIDQILDFTHVRIGRGIPLERRRTDLERLCALVLDELKGDGEREPAVALDICGDVVGEWDEDRLSQLLSNLAGNAFQHRPSGTPITIRIDGSDADLVKVELENEGVIPPEMVPVLFEPLRGGADDKREGSSGLGLGLYISQQIARAHGGEIRVEAAPKTRFIVELPRVPPPEAEQVFSREGATGEREQA